MKRTHIASVGRPVPRNPMRPFAGDSVRMSLGAQSDYIYIYIYTYSCIYLTFLCEFCKQSHYTVNPEISLKCLSELDVDQFFMYRQQLFFLFHAVSCGVRRCPVLSCGVLCSHVLSCGVLCCPAVISPTHTLQDVIFISHFLSRRVYGSSSSSAEEGCRSWQSVVPCMSLSAPTRTWSSTDMLQATRQRSSARCLSTGNQTPTPISSFSYA